MPGAQVGGGRVSGGEREPRGPDAQVQRGLPVQRGRRARERAGRTQGAHRRGTSLSSPRSPRVLHFECKCAVLYSQLRLRVVVYLRIERVVK